jgi:hypothetical protein
MVKNREVAKKEKKKKNRRRKETQSVSVCLHSWVFFE